MRQFFYTASAPTSQHALLEGQGQGWGRGERARGAELQLVFTSADDLIGFLNSTILPVARQFGYEVLVRPVGMAVVRPGV
jgi:hypothetical protein